MAIKKAAAKKPAKKKAAAKPASATSRQDIRHDGDPGRDCPHNWQPTQPGSRNQQCLTCGIAR